MRKETIRFADETAAGEVREQNMIYIEISDPEFYDDAVALVRSFYPRTEVVPLKEDFLPDGQALVIRPAVPQKQNRRKREVHEEFKRALYGMLCNQTGNTLPWGDLTGVRPSKIAYTMLEQGASDAAILKAFTTEHFVEEHKAALALQVARTEKALLDPLDYRNGYSLYIGIPFCPTTCIYCSFTSYSLAAYASKVDLYLDALMREMAFTAAAMHGRRLDTVYFGGGTPTALSAGQLDRLLNHLKQCFEQDKFAELTVEAGRPDSITAEKLAILKKHGVDRISINPQTMNDRTLEQIGRRHTVAQVVEAFHLARAAGCDNINMDIILGLPGENAAMVQNTLEQIAALSPESLTVHSLALKRAAALNIRREEFAGEKMENSDDLVCMAADYAARMGMAPYYMYRQKNMAGNLENVGYAAPGRECIYNILIMEEKQTIVALGAGASSKMVFHAADGGPTRIERIENVKDVGHYIARIDEMIARKKDFIENNRF